MAGGDKGGVPLSLLLKREQSSERAERPDVLHGQASQSKKGEDFTFLKAECQRVAGDGFSTFSVFALFDGHNGSAAAIYSKENLLNNVLSSTPTDLNRDEWIAALPRALVAAFVRTDKDFQDKEESSGTTATFVIIDGYVVTVASVGDSSCILESAEGSVYSLSEDHRLEVNVEEVKRVIASGGEVGRINTVGGAEFGPLRCWPGGLCLSRSIGDLDVGEFIVPVPHVKQIKLSSAGGRLVISSDGVWDALTSEMALSCSRGLPADVAATQIVKVLCSLCSDTKQILLLLSEFSLQEAVQLKGLRDDTTCIVVDILPPVKVLTVQSSKRPGKGVLKSIFRKKTREPTSHPKKKAYFEPDVVEMFEDGSAVLAKRLNTAYPVCHMFKVFMCAVCQLEMKPGEGISVHGASVRPGRFRPWDGPFLCKSCQAKKEAMEGKQPS